MTLPNPSPATPRTHLAGLVLAALATATASQAQVYDWAGTANADANARSNWTLASGTDAFVDGVGASTAILRTSAVSSSMNLTDIFSARDVRINAANNFTVNADSPSAALRLFGGSATDLLAWVPATSAGSLTFNAPIDLRGQGRIRAEGNTMNINGGIALNAAGTVAFFPAANRTINVNGDITAVGGNPVIEFIGAGTTVLAGNNALGSGGLRVRGTDGHTLVLANNNALGGVTNQNFGLGDGNAASGTLVTDGAVSIGRNFRVLQNSNFTVGGRSAHVSNYTGTFTLGADGQNAAGLTLTAADGGRVNFTGQLALATGTLNTNLSSVTVNAHANGVVNLGHAAGNTYAGGTIVQSGTLLVNNTAGSGTGSGNVTVQSGATLGGGGFIDGATTIQAGGFLTPGNSAGTLTFNNNLILAGTASFEIDGTARGTSFDGVNVGGDLSLGGALLLNFGSLAATGTYDLFAVTGDTIGSFSSVAIAGAHTGSLSLDANVWSGSIDGLTFSFSQLTGDLSVIPEPSAFAALTGLGVLGLAATRRRRRA